MGRKTPCWPQCVSGVAILIHDLLAMYPLFQYDFRLILTWQAGDYSSPPRAEVSETQS